MTTMILFAHQVDVINTGTARSVRSTISNHYHKRTEGTPHQVFTRAYRSMDSIDLAIRELQIIRQTILNEIFWAMPY
jgi:hypothetical protein